MDATVDPGLVSVVIPVFNGERFLAEAIESTLAQTYAEVEVIVVDDGSTDGTAGVARAYPEVLLLEQENRGPAAARNAGLVRATGEWITFLDADDVMLPHRLSVQVAHLREHPATGCVLGKMEPFRDAEIRSPSWLVPDRLFGELGGIPPMSMMVPRWAFDRVGPFDETFPIGEDTDLLYRMRAADVGIAILDEVLIRRRVHASNVTHDLPGIRENLLRGVAKHLAARRSEDDR